VLVPNGEDNSKRKSPTEVLAEGIARNAEDANVTNVFDYAVYRLLTAAGDIERLTEDDRFPGIGSAISEAQRGNIEHAIASLNKVLDIFAPEEEP
jgi:hypothetical protein